jgi:hypothetical protein
MTLMAKRIVPIRVMPTCVGMALTSSFSLGRASDEVDQGVPSVAAGTHPKRYSADTLSRKGLGPRVQMACTYGAVLVRVVAVG